MAAAPEGTVTLLFSDIEGSTSLLQRAGDAYADLLLAHRELMRAAFAAEGGFEVGTEGDSFFVTFPTAGGAARAALAAQQALRAHPWPDGLEVRVRIGLHTGEPRLRDGNYIGLDVHHAARVMAAGHGGQILATQTTRDLLAPALPVRDLGDHRLKDLSGPQRLYQLDDGDHPPLKTLHRSNLPVSTTPFIGREPELAELAALIATSRLVTLSGVGGAGKTRLALQAAANAADDWPGGVWFVALAAVDQAAAIGPAVAVALGVPEETLDSALEQLQALVVLDNLEQIPQAGDVVAGLLQQAPLARFLVTSRERLGLLAEQEYTVPALELGPAVELFTSRARRVKPSFEPDRDTEAICLRLQGLPLAIELAAGRVAILAPAQILERLGSALDFLASRAADVPERQRTLRGTIDWSYRLLPDDEAVSFQALGVFAGGFDLDAAEAVASVSLDTLSLLADKNLVRAGGDGRFLLFETLREYARERLGPERIGELSRRHALHYVLLAERAEPEGEGRDQRAWFDHLDAERDNIRAALEWSLEHDPVLALRIVGALGIYWSVRGPLLESLRFCERALAAAAGESEERWKAMLATSYLAHRAGRSERAAELATAAASAYARTGDARGRGRALRDLSNALTGIERWDESRAALLDAMEYARLAGDDWNVAIVLNNLGYVARGAGDAEEARSLALESVTLRERIGDLRGLVLSLQNLAFAEIELGLLADARASVVRALREAVALGYREGIAGAIMPLGAILTLGGSPEEGVRLLGAARRSDDEDGLKLDEPEQRIVRAALEAVRADPVAHANVERWLAEGGELGLEAAVELALQAPPA